MEQHQQGRAGRAGAGQPIEVDKIAIGSVPPFAPVSDGRFARKQRRHDGLQMRVRQPEWRAVVRAGGDGGEVGFAVNAVARVHGAVWR